MAYFSLKCFEPKIGRYIIIGLNVVLLILGIIHFGCKQYLIQRCGTHGKFYFFIQGFWERVL